MPAYALIADDLTGACDAGVQFAERGLATVVWLGASEPPPCDLLVLSTASRHDEPAIARSKVKAACGRLRLAGRELVFKKLDSTLRGNILAEVEACGVPEAWIAPAFPAMGRQLIERRLIVNGEPAGARLDAAPGVRIFDSVTQADLAAVAREAFAQQCRPLLAGSAGLAVEVANELGCPGFRKPSVRGRRGHAVLFLGSTHEATTAQIAWVRGHRDPHQYRVVTVKSLEGPLAGPIARFQARGASGLIMTGGDTAALVCRVLGANGVRLLREALPGIACGTLIGGPLQGVTVITKAGGFGAENTLGLLIDILREGIE